MEPPKIEFFAVGQRLDLDSAVGELAAPAGLFLVAAMSCSLLADGLSIRNLWGVEDHLDMKSLLELGNRDLDV